MTTALERQTAPEDCRRCQVRAVVWEVVSVGRLKLRLCDECLQPWDLLRRRVD